MITLREYQKECVDLIDSKQSGRYLIQMATGLGKTATFTHINRKGRVLVLAHREELITQPIKYYDCPVGIEMASNTSNDEDVVIASVQSLAHRLQKFKKDEFDTIIIDEAHHAAATTYMRILDYFEPRLVLGFTATPNRGDKQRLDHIFQEIIFQRDLRWAIENGYLTDIYCLRVNVGYDISKVARRMGDFAVGELEEAMNQEAANKILKILEEPWDKTLFILVSEHPEQLLATITSRTQEVSVGRIEIPALVAMARAAGKGEDEALNMARLAGGSVLELRELINGATDEARAQSFELFTRLMRLAYNDKHLELFEWADDISALTREGQRQFFLHSVRLLREAYMIHAGLASISYLWGEELKFCRNFAPYIGNQNIEILVEEIERAMLQIQQNGSPRIVFTHFALAVSKQINRL